MYGVVGSFPASGLAQLFHDLVALLVDSLELAIARVITWHFKVLFDSFRII